MDGSIQFLLLLQVLLIALNAVFACAEIAVISMNDSKLAKLAAEGDKRAIRLARLTSQPARFLATIQVAITLSGFLGSAFAAENFSGVLVEALLSTGLPVPEKVLDSAAVIFITIVLSYFTLVFGELVPKQVAMRKAETLALGMSGLISGIARVFAPLVSFLTVSTNGVLRLIGINPDAPEDEVSEEEILMMVDAGSEKGTIDHEERDFIQNVFDFDNLSIESIVTHRTDVKLLDIEDSSEIWDNTIRENPYTYFPVCDGSPDKIIGVLNSKLYFRLAEKSRGTVMEQAVKPAYFVPESLKADALFRNMKKERSPFAVVLDEYGGMSGIITIKDLIEELVGDLEDDVVPEQGSDPVKQLADGSWLVDGSIDLEELSSVVGVALSSEDYDTLNGLIFHKVGRLPEAGMELTVESLRIRVEELREYQIKLASIKRITD